MAIWALFLILSLAFIKGAGDQNKAYDEAVEKEFEKDFGPEDIIEQGRSQLKKNRDAFCIILVPGMIVKWIKQLWT